MYKKNERQNTQDNLGDLNSFKYDYEIKISIWKNVLINICKNLLVFFQTLHFLHGLSLLTKIKFLEDIYKSICDDSVFEIIFGDEEKDDNKIEQENAILYMFEYFNKNTKLNVAELISKESRIEFLTSCFSIISGMSYCNSIFSLLVNFMNDEKNKILSYKIVL
jgi:hypothetical protein